MNAQTLAAMLATALTLATTTVAIDSGFLEKVNGYHVVINDTLKKNCQSIDEAAQLAYYLDNGKYPRNYEQLLEGHYIKQEFLANCTGVLW